MIRFAATSFRYDDAAPWVLSDLDLTIEDAEFMVVVGPTGSGKSTLLRLINGLIPHFSGGQLAGDVQVGGRSILDTPPTEFAGTVGYVGQDPAASFVTDRVEDEIAYAMENLGIDPMAMRRRVEDALDLLNLHELRDSALSTLSGGQQQRVAIAAVLAASPRILVLDEPTSALDPGAAEEVLHALTRLVHDMGLTVVIAEHRLERVLPFADRVILLGGDGSVDVGTPSEIMEFSPIAPPIVELGRLAKWTPLPITVRDARRRAHALVECLVERAPHAEPSRNHKSVASLDKVSVSYGSLRALDRVSVSFHSGSIAALMGRNGSGKSTLLGTLAGIVRASTGRVEVAGHDPVGISAAERIRLVGLVPQDAGVLLYAQSIAQECATADREHRLAEGTTATMVAKLIAVEDDGRHPRDLSEGQRLSLVLGVVVAPKPALLLLDEPTRGLDYAAKRALGAELRALRDDGVCVVVATHDVEFVAGIADRALVIAQGEMIADGPARDVVAQTPAFAPQVAKVLQPLPFLTVDEVREALWAES